MPLFWIVNMVDGKPVVFVQDASAMILARLKASIAGHGGTYSQAHELTATMARKVPKGMRGRPLTAKETKALLKKLG